MIYDDKSVAFNAILAASSAHMFSLGLISETSFFTSKQRSLTSMITELNIINEPESQQQPVHLPPSAVDDTTILAALLLLGPEIINAGSKDGPAQIRWLLRGAQSLIRQRHKYFTCSCPLAHPGRQSPRYRLDSSIFSSCVRSLAFTDIMTSVPCARKPTIHKEYWLRDAVQVADEGLRTMKPDPDLGYSAPVLSLLGDSATLVMDLLAESVPRKVFWERQYVLLQGLDNAQKNAQQYDTGLLEMSATLPTNSTESRLAHTYNIAATTCLALATQIFLLRATDFDPASASVGSLCSKLHERVSIIPIEHSAATTILWPLWVLGCESYPDSSCLSRHDVATRLQQLYESQRMKNVKQCLDTLKSRIWHQHPIDSMDEQCLGCCPQQQSTWVIRCWQERIELLLA